jgi:hypothetical protein
VSFSLPRIPLPASFPIGSEKTIETHFRRELAVRISLVAILTAFVLSGCSAAPVLTSNPAAPAGSEPGASIRGVVHGGQNPVYQAHVYLYAVGDTGYGGAAVSLLTSGDGSDSLGTYVLTGADGSFNISGDYTCTVTANYPSTYILAVGGDPTGLDTGSVNNTAISLVAPTGDCSKSNFSSVSVVVNEVTTIGTVYAASSILTDLTHSSAPPPSDALAFTALSNINTDLLFASPTGVARATTPAGNGAVPQAEINTLANILAACVNTTSSSSSNCQTLFNNAKNGGVAPADTASAALNIAHNPGANVASLFGLQSGNADFIPDLATAPNDFTIAITYTGGGLNQPTGIAIDASGDVWVSNESQTTPSISAFGPDGTPMTSSPFTGGGLTGGSSQAFPGIGIDAAGDVWVVNPGSSLSKFSSAGAAISGSGGYTGGGLNIPDFIAIDKSNNIWTGNRGDFSLSEFNSSGMAVSGSGGFTGGGLGSPCGVAFDISGNLWTADNGLSGSDGNSLSEVSSTGTPVSGSPFTGGGLVNPFALAIDPTGNIWLTDTDPSSALSEFSSNGAALSGAGAITGGGLNSPGLLAIDSAGNVFVPNLDGNSVSEFNSSRKAITGSSGYTGWLPPSGGSTLSTPLGAAIDGDGNVWVTNSGNNTVTEFVGLASPVVTPIVANLLAPYGSSAVNKP